jgi:uncharacterized protein YkwD
MADYVNDWYYMEPNPRGHAFVRGPFSAEEIYTLLKKGKISGSTNVRCGSNAFWHPLDDALPLITKLATGPAPKAARSAFWKRHKAALLIALLIVLFIVIIKQVPHPMLAGVPWLFAPRALSTQWYPVREPISAQAIVSLTNSVRTLNGLAALTENQLLDTVAEQRARDILEKQYFAHVSPTGEEASDLAERAGYRYQIIAENLASGIFLTNQKLIDGWMQSPSHRKNILLPDVRETGVSAIKGRLMGEDIWVFVQIFGLRSLPASGNSCVRPSQQLLNEIEIKKSELKSLQERITRLREELDSEKSSIESDRMAVGNDARKNHDLNVKIAAYNAKSNWHNQCLAELKGKERVMNAMVEEYNRALEAYRECHRAN